MTSQEIVFEEAQPTDAEQVSRFLEALTQESDFVTKDSPALTGDQMASFLSHQLESPADICLLAKLGSQVIGLVNVVSLTGDKGLSGDLFIGVKDSYRGLGIGQILLDLVIDWAGEMAVLDRLSLSVQARNARAIHLYKKFGFRIVNEHKAAVLGRSGEWLDVYDMIKTMA